jgi:outer membrane protein OmpA-like peptidoglycan-associated protein
VSRRPEPWPAVTDLFAALLLATFGGLTLLTSLGGTDQKAQRADKSPTPASSQKAPADPVDQEAQRLVRDVREALEKAFKKEASECGNHEVCLDVPIEFGSEQYRIDPDLEIAIEQACKKLRDVLTEEKKRKLVSIVVEGHTDDRVMENPSDPLKQYLVNWEYSARRAGAIMNKFRAPECGLSETEYRIWAEVYADTKPVCKDEVKTEDCRRRNRRTTFRLRADREEIRKFLKEQEQGQTAR